MEWNRVGPRLSKNFILVLVIYICTAISQFTEAAEIRSIHSNGRAILLIQGNLELGDEESVARILRRTNFQEVWLNSNGGRLVTGIGIGRVIRSSRLATRIPRNATCASSCVFAFVGGIVREVNESARVGVHMASLMFSDKYIKSLRRLLISKKIKKLDDRIRLITLLNEQFSAKAIASMVHHFIKMGVSMRLLNPSVDTPIYEIYWLSRKEIRDFNVANSN